MFLIPFVCTFKTVYKFSDSCKEEEILCILTARNLNKVLKVFFSMFGCRSGINVEKRVTTLIDRVYSCKSI